jgi:quercetin dioxygenase-like cupin family protein
MHRLALILAATFLAPQVVAPEVEISAEPHHHLVLENQFVRVFNVQVAPHADTLMHWHRHDYIYVTLGPTEVVNQVLGKQPVTVRLQDGQTGFSPAPVAHLARNLSDQTFRNVTIEILQDDKLRHSPPHWDPNQEEDRGLDILQGGTEHILFVQDNIRATEFELQPGGVVPMHHHTGPHLLIAVTDLALHSAVEGQSPGPVGLKSGEVRWVPGGFSHPVTNTGHQSAKFVTLEFP